MSKHLVFVYGTLRRGQGLHGVLEECTFLGEDSITGSLLHLGSYPGFIDGEGTVVGECYRVDDNKMHLLDQIELGAGYKRERRELHLRGELAWVYVYLPYAPAPAIASGDWCKQELAVA